jgi:hypothetical protein
MITIPVRTVKNICNLPATTACGSDFKNALKKPQRNFWGFFMVPRDRIELPTRGFSDQVFEILKML